MTTAAVMIVDDSLVIRAVVRAGLEAEGYQVMLAEDGLSALEQCASHPPDVILLDVIMPGLDGYQVLAQLKDNPDLAHIPVVFLTSRTNMADVVAGLRAGAHDYLRKPFEPEELLARVGSAVQVKRLQDQLRERNAELDRLTRTDTLTGLYNRRHLDEELARRYADSQRYRDPLGVLLLDIDHFKNVNDTYGHLTGDAVLREFASRVADELRATDVAARWGGEEFLVLLPRADVSGVAEVADRIRAVTAARPFIADSASVPVTVSGGCAAGVGQTPDELLRLADAALYDAKRSGRNRIVLAAPSAVGQSTVESV